METSTNKYQSINPVYKDHLTEIYFTDMAKFWNESQLLIRKKFPQLHYDFDEIFSLTYYKLYKYQPKFDKSKTIINLVFTFYKNNYINYQTKKLRHNPTFIDIDTCIRPLVGEILDIDSIDYFSK